MGRKYAYAHHFSVQFFKTKRSKKPIVEVNVSILADNARDARSGAEKYCKRTVDENDYDRYTLKEIVTV